ncbi:AsnC family protein [Amycolatopsis panacis]|uniref:AsnC family protein n=1 Tax=Amycolatopsis panacis TaxID=2340917 RepID=UPI0038996691
MQAQWAGGGSATQGAGPRSGGAPGFAGRPGAGTAWAAMRSPALGQPNASADNTVHSGQYGPAHGVPSGAYGAPSGVRGTPSGAYGSPSGVQGAPSGPYGATVQGAPSGAYGTPGPSGAYGVQPAQSGPYGAPSGAYGVTGAAAVTDPAVTTWGVPQTASWARGDEPRLEAPAGGQRGRIGEKLETQGLEGEQLTVQLLEVQDPADFLFGAAGYRLEEGERAVVVHTEITNRGSVPFASLPDNYLELLTADSGTVAKAPVSLTSRPPHKIGVRPGETLGGHTVYVLPEATQVVSVRWSPRPEPDERTLTWTV